MGAQQQILDGCTHRHHTIQRRGIRLTAAQASNSYQQQWRTMGLLACCFDLLQRRARVTVNQRERKHFRQPMPLCAISRKVRTTPSSIDLRPQT